jgi:hypothetical protein
LPALLAPSAWVASDQILRAPALIAHPPPAGIAPERYFLYHHRVK